MVRYIFLSKNGLGWALFRLLRLMAESALVVTLVAVPAHAQWVEATGYATVSGAGDQATDYSQAREAAMSDALRQAAQQLQTQSGNSLSNSGSMDGLSAQVKATVREMSVLDEQVIGNLYTVRLKADLIPRAACALEKKRSYRKKVAMLGFMLQTNAQTSLGGLTDIQRGVPAMLADQLGLLGDSQVYSSSQQTLYGDVQNAPSSESQLKTLTKAVQLAKQMGVQFVISGVIRDLSSFNPHPAANSALDKMSSWLGLQETRRHFAVDIFVHDGLSGDILMQKRFETVGEWDQPANESVGFGSPAFLETSYGQAVNRLLGEMALSLNDALRCQPFMVRITRMEDKTLHFDAGALSGIRPGDELAVYRTYQFYDSNGLKGMELANAKSVLSVTQVHPDFSSGILPIEPGRLNIQEDDLLIAW
ncbi:MAG: flagellar assembly protein T N-terminal domain-containing protein [Hahellaceae bacterium]|nr:flagellar assembly protein T N-terminal domain-containing protein [Hahellaceae bacterium]MCP5168686.1 flagellar assembly protein T N-terminal domain-containing protein [Hahellaceae bacterium]